MLLSDAIDFLYTIGLLGAFYLALPLLLFEIPRYTLIFFSSTLLKRNPQSRAIRDAQPYTVVITGHNEADKIHDCVVGLNEQSHPPEQILVMSDGSVDAMQTKMRELQDRGLIDGAHHTDIRSGKAAGMNYIHQLARNEIIISIDADTSFDRHAMRRMCEEFNDPTVGIVSGNLAARNARHNLITSMQEIEYLISIGVGRRAAGMVNQIAISSGAFTGFRRSALTEVQGHDAGVGEDLDITLRLRQRGWFPRFAAEAIGYTNVPETVRGLVRQRLRWERDSIEVRYRKNFDVMNLLDRRFSPLEATHNAEFFIFNFIAAAITPLYLIFVWLWFEEGTLIVMTAAFLLLVLHDFTVFLVAIHVNPRIDSFIHILTLPLYSLFFNLLMRSLRLYAYIDEWLNRRTEKSYFVPEKVRNYIREYK